MKIKRALLTSWLGVSLCAALLLSSPVCAPASLGKPKTKADETTVTNEQIPVYEPGKKLPKGMAESAVDIMIASTPTNVWNALVKFENYPRIFKRIKTSEIIKRDGDLIYVETYLKPQMFVKNAVQHTVTNIADSPHRINWKQLDGNFKHVDGSWELAAQGGGKTKLTYTLHVDAGAMVPPSMVSFFLKFVQNEIVKQLKQYVEKEEKTKETPSVSLSKSYLK